MKTTVISLFVVFLCCNVKAQQIDSVITTDIYTSYVSFSLHEPLYVKYKLYQGGGDCSRKKMNFKPAGFREGARAADYKRSGYDKGHLVNAEDFAGDCRKEKETFRFYNCLPQTPELNRGIWNHWEMMIRKESQEDSLLILCGGAFSSGHTIGKDEIGVPDYCWKMVFSLTTHHLLHCLWFKNDASQSYEKVSEEELKNSLHYPLNLDY